MLVGSSLTLCGIICNNKAMLSPGFLRYDPSKSNYGLLVTIVASVLFAFLHTTTLKSRQSLSCLCGTAAAPLGMPEATPTTHQALRGRIQTYFYGLPTLSEYPLLPEGRILALYWVHRGVVGSHHVPSNFPPQSSGARSTRAPGTRFRSQTVVARRRPSEVRRHRCSTLLDTLPPS